MRNPEMNAESGKVTVKDTSLGTSAEFATLLDMVVVAYLYTIFDVTVKL